MPFGNMPNESLWKRLFLEVFGWPNMIRRIQAPVIMRMLELKDDELVLDIGCGAGFFTFELAKRCRATGVDWRLDKGLAHTNKKHKAMYLKGDVQKLPLTSQKFDKILLSSVLQMVEEDVTLLDECSRILKEEGVLVLSVPTKYYYVKKLNDLKPQLKKRFGSMGKKGYYEPDEVIELLLNKGFRIIERECSPKKWGSLIFEIGLFLWYQFGFPFFSPFLFPILYPITYLDNFDNSKQTGNELVIKVMKATR